MMAVLTVIAVAAVIRHAFCSGVSAGLLFSIPPSERARRLAEVISLDDGVIVLAAIIFMHVITDSQRRPFVGRTAVSLWVREALLCHIVTKHLNVASQHVTECNDFVLPPPRTGAPDSLAVCLKRVVLERKKVSKVLLILSFPRKSFLFNHKSHARPPMHTPTLACTHQRSHARAHMRRQTGRERLQQTRGQANMQLHFIRQRVGGESSPA